MRLLLMQGVRKEVPPLMEILVGILLKNSSKKGTFFPDTLYR